MTFRLCILTTVLMVAAAEAKVLDVAASKEGFLAKIQALLFENAERFFDFENAGTTKLGQLLAWKGDALQPVMLFGMAIFTVYTGLRIILTLIGGIFNIKAAAIGSIIGVFQDLFAGLIKQILMIKNPIIEKLSALVQPDADDTTPVADRTMRALEEVSDAVMAAINKYD